MQSERITFPGSLNLPLVGRLDRPSAIEPSACALFAHCFTCSKNLNAVSNISRSLTAAGIAVLRFDFTGLGESAGDFADTNFSSNVADLVAAAAWMAKMIQPPQLLIGHSLGGAAVLQAATQIDACRAVVTIGAPCEPQHVANLLLSSRAEIERSGEARVRLAGREFTIRRQFLEDLSAQKMTAIIANLRRALLILHSPLDATVSIDNAAHIFTTARHPKSFVSLDTADHLLSKSADSRYAGAVIAAWADRYVG